MSYSHTCTYTCKYVHKYSQTSFYGVPGNKVEQRVLFMSLISRYVYMN